jgi:hypothetical protein
MSDWLCAQVYSLIVASDHHHLPVMSATAVRGWSRSRFWSSTSDPHLFELLCCCQSSVLLCP